MSAAARLNVSAIRRLSADIGRRLGWRAPALITLMTVSGLAEGMGLVLLFPLLGQLGVGQGGAPNVVGRTVAELLGLLGIAINLPVLLLLLVCTVVLQHVIFLGQSWLGAHYQQSYVAAWRNALFNAILAARWSFFTQRRVGELINALVPETQRLSDALFLLGQIVTSLIFIVIYLALAFAAAWPIALVIITFAVVMGVVTRPLLRRGSRAGSQVTQRAIALQTIAGEFLSGAKFIKASASEDRAAAKFGEAVHNDFELVRSMIFYPNLIRSIYEVAAIGLLALCLWLGLIVLGIDAASILVSVYIFVRVYQRLSVLQQNLQALQNYAPAIETVSGMLQAATAEIETQSEPANESSAAFLSHEAPASIALKNVTVRYAGVPAISAVSLVIPPGTVLGLAGPSGAGKSTLVDCILGLTMPDEGEIEIGGVPLTELPLRRWRQAVGYVAQDTFLLNVSVRDNIRWGNPAASDAEIAQAARRADLDATIRALPRGYDTEVGDRGVRLSGGQRQRIGLARAILGHARLLIFDEATSALDSESERLILQTVSELRRSMTVIMIAHRLSTLRDADVIYFLECGQIVETGTWPQLIRYGTRFHDFWALQSEERPALASP